MTTPVSDDGMRHPPPPFPGGDGPVRIAGVHLTTQLFSGTLIIGASFLPWTSQSFSSSSAFGVPLRALLDPRPTSAGFVRLAFLLVPLGLLVLASGIRVLPPVVARAAGIAAALTAFVFVAQLQLSMGKLYAATVLGVLGIGVYLTLLGGLLAAVSQGDRSTS